ncbi:MAG: TonB-dependent receptor [Elusimicrobiota bacterium]|nr:MAG: TonB-dependent receptor [Elusimicrobiota bacterium]
MFSYTGGERSTHIGQALIGDRRGAHAYKLGLGWRSTNKFAVAAAEASAVGKVHALYSFDFGEDSRIAVSGGVSDHDVQLSNGPSFDYGETGFARVDARTGATTARLFWNFGRTVFRENPTLPFRVHNDTYDASFERAFELPASNFLTTGASYRRNTARSNLFSPGTRDQALYGLYFENSWAATERWTFVLSGRADHHPFTDWQYSPRGSAIYAPSEAHSFRATAAQAFRNPTLLENYFDLRAVLPLSTAPGFTQVDLTVVPNRGLDPERIQFFEVAHRGSWEFVRTGITGFYYRVANLVTALNMVDRTSPPVILQRSVVTNAGETKALGYELSIEAQATDWLVPFANYSYQSLIDQRAQQTTARSAPRHKMNLGARVKRPLWTANAWLHLVDETWWSDGTNTVQPVYAKVPAYAMLNVAATRRFTGRFDGLELTVAGFNIADDHYELLPRQSAVAPGRNGGPIKSRWSGTLAWRFGLPR